MKKRLFLGCFLAVFLLLPAQASDGGIQVLLDGTPLTFDTPPLVVENRTLVPFRAIFEALGYTVDWDGGSGVTAASKEHQLRLTIGQPELQVDGAPIPLDGPPRIQNDRTLIPLRAVAEASGCQVCWDQPRQTALLWREGALPAYVLYDDLSTDGVYLYYSAFRGPVQISLADQSVQVLPLLGRVCQPKDGKLYGRFGVGADNLAFASYDLTTGEKQPITTENVGELFVYEDHIYHGTAYRTDLKGENREELPGWKDGRIGYYTIRDGLLFGDSGWVVDPETGETVIHLTSGLADEEWRDFYELGGQTLWNDWYLVPVSLLSGPVTQQPVGILAYNRKTGEEKTIPKDAIIEKIRAAGDSILYTVNNGETSNTGTLYRQTGLDGTPDVLAEEIYVSEFNVIGNYAYYTREALEGETELEPEFSGATALCRKPIWGGEEQVITFNPHW